MSEWATGPMRCWPDGDEGCDYSAKDEHTWRIGSCPVECPKCGDMTCWPVDLALLALEENAPPL